MGGVLGSGVLALMLIAYDLVTLKDGKAKSKILGPILIGIFSTHLVQLSLRAALWDFCSRVTDIGIWSV